MNASTALPSAPPRAEAEAQASEPFSDRKDAVQRLVVEQFVTFPRFVLSGGWWQAWRQRHRH